MGHEERAPACALATAIAIAATPQPVPSRHHSGLTQPLLSSESGRVSRAKAAEDPPSSWSARPPPRGSSLGCPPSGARRARLPTGRLSVSSFFPCTNDKCLAVPQRWDLSQTCWHKNTELDYYTAKNASRDLCRELNQKTLSCTTIIRFVRLNSHWVSSLPWR